jgi:hypothetical protein
MTAQHPAAIAYAVAKLAAAAAVAKRDAAISAHKDCIEAVRVGRLPWHVEHHLAIGAARARGASRDAMDAVHNAAVAVADAVLSEVAT